MTGDCGYHVDCVELVTPDLMIGSKLDPGIWDATLHEPPWEEHMSSAAASRLRWLENTFAQNLYLTIRRRLPLEVCRMIAQYFHRERATQALRDLWMKSAKESGGSPIPVYQSVHVKEYTALRVHFTQFEDRQYVETVEDATWVGTGPELFTFNPGMSVNIFMASDFLGVRQIITRPEGEIPKIEPQSGVGWNIYRQMKLPFFLKGHWDCIKMRRLAVLYSPQEYPKYDKWKRQVFHQMKPRDFHNIRWPVIPMPLESFPSPSIPGGLYADRNEIVQAMDWNTSGTYGYSFSLWNNTIFGVIAHRTKEKVNYGSINDGHGWKRWVYLPIDPDERISELWVRDYVVAHDYNETSPDRSLIVGIDSSFMMYVYSFAVVGSYKQRSQPCPGPWLTGNYDWPGRSEIKYKAIVKLPDAGSSRMFLENRDFWYTWLAFEQVSTWKRREVLLPASRSSLLQPDDCKYYHTSAALEDVIEVSACRPCRKSRRPNAIMGLLFTYFDGHQRSVGEVRLDSLEELIKVSSHKEMEEVLGKGPTGEEAWMEVFSEGIGCHMNDVPVSEND
ncbi:hypothetical protein F53441_8633 [Fusarium austroafricanum]|uniref:Uncharacterized protein n=1 Tax=Fusarium austroafricanum TaxID=2364996 RepID=A0A8H4KEP3_9HYPO|nr:hypothetical protein F53441_8633 [Fusarium austroafricanum]